MKTVLCIEAGDFGGGSAESLYTHICSLKEKYNFICIFTSRNRFSKKIEKLDVTVHYSLKNYFNIEFIEKNWRKAKFFNLLYKLTFRFNLFLHNKIAYLFNKKFYKLFEEIIKSKSIDLIHTNNQPNRDFLLIKIASKYNKPVVSHIRSSNTYGFSSRKSNFCNTHTRAFITYSSFLKKIWSDKKLEINKINVISNTVEVLSEKDLIKAAEPIDTISDLSCTKIGLVGRIIPERGHLFALDTLHNLKSRGNDVRLYIIGDHRGFESYFQKVQDKVSELGLVNDVIFTGFVNNPYQFIFNMDILFLPYTIEPFGRTLLESWQLKTPVVLSDLGHINDVVEHCENGMLYKFQNIESSVNCIESIINDSDLQKKLIRKGYKMFYDGYTPQNYANKIQAVYRKAFNTQHSVK